MITIVWTVVGLFVWTVIGTSYCLMHLGHKHRHVPAWRNVLEHLLGAPALALAWLIGKCSRKNK